ncbi:MAG: electron transfer flavoprotein subunit beta/FixA family protein [Candidatus Thermoplasmatota archaeon]|nr:electron transfer flavoprotein subunit beta/FixA family protein [Candidatus Thermoplasmatota archaeon]
MVPKPEEVTLDPETKTLDRANAENVLNPPDKNALETALRLKEAHGGTVTLISMGPPLFRKYLELCLGMGADRAILLSDRTFAGADTYPTSLTLAKGIQKLKTCDLVICGEESSDASTAQVPPGLAEWLDMSLVTFADEVAVHGNTVRARRTLGSSYEILEADMPAVVSVVVGSNEPRFPDFDRVEEAAGSDWVQVWAAADLGLKEEDIGLKGSYTIVHELVEGEPVERKREFLEGGMEEKVKALAKALEPFLEA